MHSVSPTTPDVNRRYNLPYHDLHFIFVTFIADGQSLVRRSFYSNVVQRARRHGQLAQEVPQV